MLTKEQRDRLARLVADRYRGEDLCAAWRYDRELLVAELEACRRCFGASNLGISEREFRRIEAEISSDIALLDAAEGRVAGVA